LMVCGWLELRGVSRLELGRIGREVVFDHERVVVNAGIVLAVALGRRLGIEARVDGGGQAGGAGRLRPGRKVLWLIHALLLGAS
jgi:hypothetical protein